MIDQVRTEIRRVAILSLATTYLFFFEYLPPVQRVHFVWDIEGYHYPLLQYAFQSLRQGRLPEWDPTQYCGLSFVGNVQAALFYPPNWLLFAAHLGRPRLSFLGLEIFVIAHFWLAFFLCYSWLRNKAGRALPAALGAGVFAYSGYMVSQVQHVGVVTGYAWIPLGLWAIDEAAGRAAWRPLWMLIAASALCFLAGYPPTWLVFSVCMVTYAATSAGWRTAVATVLALVSSLLVVMVQVLPALEAAVLKVREVKYQGGVWGGTFYLSYFLPNFFDVGRQAINGQDPTRQYFYLGAPVFFGLAWMARRRHVRNQIPALAIAAVSLAVFVNPFGLVDRLVLRFQFLSEVCRDWNFLAGLTLAGALLAAGEIEDFLRRPSPAFPRWLTPAAACLLTLWALRQWLIWLPGGAGFAPGWTGAYEPLTTLAAFSLSLYLWRGEQGPRRAILAAALLAAIGVDYKVFGTSKLFNAEPGNVDARRSDARFPNLDEAADRELHSRPDARVAVTPQGPLPTELHFYGLNTPQGFDPMLPAQYKQAVEAHTAFRTDRLFDIDPANDELLRLLAVRYYVVDAPGPVYALLAANPNFRPLAPSSKSFFRAFEYLRARPPCYWDPDTGAPIDLAVWTPERREFRVRTKTGGRLVLAEQFHPGWQATVGSTPVRIERWRGTFQAIEVPPGEQRVCFVFRSLGLRLGAGVTLLSLIGLALLIRRR